MQTNHGLTLALKNLSDEHRAYSETHSIINIVDAITPLLFVAFHAEQSFPQALVSFAKRLREERRQGPHGLPNQIVIQYSAKRKKIRLYWDKIILINWMQRLLQVNLK